MKIIVQVLIIIVSVGITLLGNYFWEKYKNQTKYLDVYVSYQNLSTVTNHDISIKFDTIISKNLYRVDVSIFNFNDHDIEELPLYIDLFGEKEGNAIVFSEEIWGSDGNKDLVEKVENIAPSNNPCGIRRNYLVKYARKGDINYPILTATYLIDAKDISKHKVFIGKPGYKEREYTLDNYYKSDQYPKQIIDTFWGKLIIVITPTIIVLIIFACVNRFIPLERKRFLHRQNIIMPELINYINSNPKNIDVKQVVKKYVALIDKYEWDNSNLFSKFLYGYRKPKMDD